MTTDFPTGTVGGSDANGLLVRPGLLGLSNGGGCRDLPRTFGGFDLTSGRPKGRLGFVLFFETHVVQGAEYRGLGLLQ